MAFLLPPAEQDPIIRLHDYYFQACDLMFKNSENLRNMLMVKQKLSQNKTVDLQSYFQLWIATLRVTTEGFQCKKVINFFERFDKAEIDNNTPNDIRLRNHWDSVQEKIKERGAELHSYRNITFHFQESMDRLMRNREAFLHYDAPIHSINWAHDLHMEIKLFFSLYRPIASALYMIKEEKIGKSKV